MSNVRNVSAISVVSCLKTSQMPMDEPVEVVDIEEDVASSPKKREVSFDPPLDFDSYLPVAFFLADWLLLRKLHERRRCILLSLLVVRALLERARELGLRSLLRERNKRKKSSRM